MSKENKYKTLKEESDESSDEEEKDTEQPPKRRPGRPRKTPLKEPQQRLGRVEKPVSDNNLIEILYDKPINFKRIGSYWKSLMAEKIKFDFKPDCLQLITSNYKETSDVVITCDGQKMNSYFCPPEGYSIMVSFENLDLILSKLDKSYDSISFVIQKKSQTKLFIILQNDVNIPEFFEIDLIMNDHIVVDGIFDILSKPDVYSLEFCLAGKHFKKMINDAKSFDKMWTIQKYGDVGNLVFTYKSANGQVKAKAVPKSLQSVNLKSKVKPKEIFSVSVYIDSIKPTSSNFLADEINIRAAKDKPLWIWAELDDRAIVLNILIDIVDHRTAPPERKDA